MPRNTVVSLALVGTALAAALAVSMAFAPAQAGPAEDKELADKAFEILKKNCFECHGQNPAKIKKGVKVLDHKLLLEAKKKLVVPKEPDESLLIQRMETKDNDEVMPPPEKPRVPEADLKLLRDWITAGAPAFSVTEATADDTPPGPKNTSVENKEEPAIPTAAQKKLTPSELTKTVKEIFRNRCQECHGDRKKIKGIEILNHKLLLDKKLVVAKKPGESAVYSAILDDSMPKGSNKLSVQDKRVIFDWIDQGAPAFEDDKKFLPGIGSVDYVLQKILEDVAKLPEPDLAYVRYFSSNHLLYGGTTEDVLAQQADALVKTINHLSLEPEIYRPEVIDAPINTIFRVDIRRLGWHQRLDRIVHGKAAGPSHINIYDLALLDYPYGIIYNDKGKFNDLYRHFLDPAHMVRPIPYLRIDWFVSNATLPPLYEDFLRLPYALHELEVLLGVDSERNRHDYIAMRSGMAHSGVSHNNRVVERHPMRQGAYWVSFDFKSSKGKENIFKDPVHLNQTGGEMIFNLPNGLQGYFVANAKGDRIEAAPTEIVVDSNALDGVVRNGLSCIRCHDVGMKDVHDDVRPAVLPLPGLLPNFDKDQVLDLYPDIRKVYNEWAKDKRRFLEAMKVVLPKPVIDEPLTPVSRRFLDDPIYLPGASYELGIQNYQELQKVFGFQDFTSLGIMQLANIGGSVNRDVWEDYFGQLVALLGLGYPVVPIDGLQRPNVLPDLRKALFARKIDLKIKTPSNTPSTVLAKDEGVTIVVSNNSEKPVNIELVLTSARGEISVLGPYRLFKPGEKKEYGPYRVQPGLGKELITIYASDAPFPPGEVVGIRYNQYKGGVVSDRFVHHLYKFQDQGGRPKLMYEGYPRIVKKTIEVETR